MSVRILHGDCREVLRSLPDASVRNDGRFKPGQHWRPDGAHRKREWLYREYVEKERSTGDIATELGFTDGAILFWLQKHGIPRRDVSHARKLKHWGLVGASNPMFGKCGPANPRYVDGSSPERQRAYVRAEGRAFLRAVYKRDEYRCVRCHAPNTGPRTLHAHHLAPWAGNPLLRFDLDNAVTLCRVCHSWVHSRANAGREYLR